MEGYLRIPSSFETVKTLKLRVEELEQSNGYLRVELSRSVTLRLLEIKKLGVLEDRIRQMSKMLVAG